MAQPPNFDTPKPEKYVGFDDAKGRRLYQKKERLREAAVTTSSPKTAISDAVPQPVKIESNKTPIGPKPKTDAEVMNQNYLSSQKISGTIDYIIGMPPGNCLEATNIAIANSMPIVYIEPGELVFLSGLALVQRAPSWEKYTELLGGNGFRLNQAGTGTSLKMAYIADNFPTDSFTNTYGENFLQGITEVAGDVGGALSQMMGARTPKEFKEAVDVKIAGLGTGENGVLNSFGKLVKPILSTTSDALAGVGGAIDDFIGGGAGLAGELAMGSRLDFPMLWKSSSFEPSYSMTIRLYNPDPSSEEITNKYIVAPIAAIMLLGIPLVSEKNSLLYGWPFLHRIYSPGIFDLDPAYIANITIVKGGDQQQIAFTQKLSMVDVRIDFGSLYSSMVASHRRLDRTRPTLGKYLFALTGGKPAVRQSSVGMTENQRSVNNEEVIPASQKPFKTANSAPTSAEKPEGIQPRVPLDVQAKSKNLLDKGKELYMEWMPG